jgi:peroxiredoxin
MTGRAPGRARRGVVVAVLGAALALAGCGVGNGSGEAADPGYASGDGTVTTWDAAHRGAPVELTGRTYAGAEVDLATWRGDVVVVNFWYAGCPPCRSEAPDLAALARDYEARGVRLLGVNSRDDAGTAQAFERTFAVPYPSLDDARSQAVAALQGVVAVRAVPTTVVLDPEGRVAARVIGRADAATLRALVEQELAA